MEQIQAALLDYIGPQRASAGYGLATEEGLYMEAQFSLRALTGMAPVWIGMLAPFHDDEQIEEAGAEEPEQELSEVYR